MLSDSDRAFTDDVRAALNGLGARELARRLKLDDKAKPQAAGIIGVCPSCGGGRNTPCWSAFDRDGAIGYRCHSCEAKGDCFAMVAVARGLDVKGDFVRVVDEGAALVGLDGQRARSTARPAQPRPQLRPVPREASPVADLGEHWQRLPPIEVEAWEYLRGRGLDGAADLCRGVPAGGLDVPGALIGQPDKPTVPWGVGLGFALALHDVAGRIVGFQGRTIGAGKHDFRVLGASQGGLFGETWRVAECSAVLVCEGLTDTLAALSVLRGAPGLAIVGVPGINARAALLQLPWKGKRALIATDADKAEKPGQIKGDEGAELIAADLAKLGAEPIRCRPVGEKDLCAMHEAGVDIRAFIRGAIGRALGFRSVADRVRGEAKRAIADGAGGLPFSVDFLRAALGRIVARDVVLVGGASGIGKTALLTSLAGAMAESGVDVHYFALEPEPDEIERRLKWQALARAMYDARPRPPGLHRLDFQAWWQGDPDVRAITKPFEAAAEDEVRRRFGKLHTFYRSERRRDASDGAPFRPADFDRMARAIRDETRVIFLDHVHYFDEDETDANQAQRRAGRRIRDLALETGRPVVMAAHLRKSSSGPRKQRPLVPELSDFQGAAGLFQPVKRAILIAPAAGHAPITCTPDGKPMPLHYATFFAIAKNTYDGSRTRYVAKVDWNARANGYAPGFVLGQIDNSGTKWTPVEDADLPDWARSTDSPEPAAAAGTTAAR